METNNKKTIIIAGGGFGGIAVARELARKVPSGQVRIVLISKTPYHAYYPNLYELATAEEEFTTVRQLKKSLAIPLTEILPAGVGFMHGEITQIDQHTKSIAVRLVEPAAGAAPSVVEHYDYLVCAFGSTTDFFNIAGLQQNALQLKSVNDALRLRNQAESIVQEHQYDMYKRTLRFIIGGGGFTGVELAGEFANLLNIVSWKYNYPREKLELMVIEGTAGLLPGLSTKVSEKIRKRFKALGIEMRFGNFISEVSDKTVHLKSGELYAYDLLVWTGGVRSVPLPFMQPISLDSKGRISTDACLRGVNNPEIFSVGDCACVSGANGKPLPQTAQQAIDQGKYVGKALAAILKGREPENYRPQENSYIIAARGKWAALHLPSGFTLFGWLPWVIKRLADLDYFWQLMPFWKAVKLAWLETELYTRND